MSYRSSTLRCLPGRYSGLWMPHQGVYVCTCVCYRHRTARYNSVLNACDKGHRWQEVGAGCGAGGMVAVSDVPPKRPRRLTALCLPSAKRVARGLTLRGQASGLLGPLRWPPTLEAQAEVARAKTNRPNQKKTNKTRQNTQNTQTKPKQTNQNKTKKHNTTRQTKHTGQPTLNKTKQRKRKTPKQTKQDTTNKTKAKQNRDIAKQNKEIKPSKTS